MEISLHNESGRPGPEERQSRELVEEVCRALKLEMISCAIILTDDAYIQSLHQTYFNDPDTTDVITFDLGEEGTEGEIYICVDQAERQAREFGVSTLNETRRLIIHGLLHLVGYDDREEADRAEMKRMENDLYEKTKSW